MTAAEIVTRFAPSPTGYLHLGHVRSALEGWRAAREAGGRFLLRFEDIDLARCREEYAAAITEDLAWLGLDWDGPVRRQSEHFDDYRAALDRLGGLGVLYPCFCTRREIQAEIARAGGAPQGETGPIYPGTCRRLGTAEREQRRQAGLDYALRLDVACALALTGPLDWVEERGAAACRVSADPTALGDVVLARKDTPASYHLAVTVDDAIQGVTLVTRGDDLAPATHTHRLLQGLLGLPTPRYRPHPLLTDAAGRRLAKRDHALTIREMRSAGLSADEIIARALTSSTEGAPSPSSG
jgi:glutamyl-Q tRNA(Asp) synthetase